MFPAYFRLRQRHAPLVALLLVAPLLTPPVEAQDAAAVALACYQDMARGAESAISNCEEAAAANDAHAHFLLALRETDIERRVARLRQAVALGHPQAMGLLAQIRRAQGAHDRANELDMLAARSGFGPSRIRIAQLLLADSENAQNVAQARQMLLVEAARGYPEAQFLVARVLRAGVGGEADPEAASRWMLEAASSGHAQAQFAHGLSVAESNPAQARRWLLKSARAGHVGAMYQLGALLARTAQNRSEMQNAAYWTGEAIRAGHPGAPQLLAQIRQARVANAANPVAGEAGIVVRVQRLLSELGYDPGPADGVPGGRTRSAIIAFERSRGLQETGVADQRVLDALEAAR